MKRLMSMLAAAACLSGCTHGRAVQTTIPAAMAGIQSTLARAGAVSVAHAGDWTTRQGAGFARMVRAAQCAQQAADPVIGTITGDVTLQLAGSFTRGGTFSVGALTTAPTIGLDTDASRTNSQQVSLPLAYAPLSSLPDVEMGRQMGYVTALFGQNDRVRQDEARRLMADRDTLRRIIRTLIHSWDTTYCTPSPPVAPFVSLRRGSRPGRGACGDGNTGGKH
ncbi:hypothetical protein [Komagataeibacter swingsii]|uniref:Lipoprotein n=1 Tax=Komagataeibacter swingsii TaxID=215220 RepID=A0A2V4QZ27_9PROT|nr:hypothetical protein [Komagataeibacter swingsii]PYD68727.1 hypothetical protein CFR76_13550 [Komagataeibacter swingsii]GBQ64874.1 hypothetical protein AA16373_2941 [Komagataeibacter swingsii DSM 16373]